MDPEHDSVTALALSYPICGSVITVVLCFLVLNFSRDVFKKKVTDFPRKFPEDADKEPKEGYVDVAIVGAGPAGSCCAYYLAKEGRKALVLEKKKFPRDKYCGDAVCKTGIEILIEMGIYQQLLDENKAKVADSGGMVSPSGLSYVGRSKELLGEIPAAVACKRIHLDEAIAMAAKKAGADLRENHGVADVVFDHNEGLWTITVEESDEIFKARVLVCADGAPSRLGTKLGIITSAPDSNCSRSYVEGGTHKFKADGVVFWNKELLPGYAALFKHPNDVLNYCVYIIPGNPKVTGDDLPHWHEKLKNEDPNVSKALGNEFKIERMRAASLRLGGVPVSYDSHVILIGDAAGMIDPLTGEGIHHAMEGGKLAAGFLEEVITHGNYDRDVMKLWHDVWMNKFGSDFKWSMRFCQLVYRYPILLDAATAAVKRKGDKFLKKWADIMTGRVPKLHMMKPEFVIVITYELMRLLVSRALGFGGKNKDQ